MTDAAEELLGCLAELGASVAPDGDRLVVRAGASGIPAALMARLRAAKPDLIAALATGAHTPSQTADRTTHPVDAAWWHGRFTIRTIHWELGGYRSHLEARCLAFGELLDEFRESQGRRWPTWQCAGCDEPIDGLSALTLADGNRIHFGDENECLIRFGRRWHGAAVAGLRALGLEAPPGYEPP